MATQPFGADTTTGAMPTPVEARVTALAQAVADALTAADVGADAAGAAATAQAAATSAAATDATTKANAAQAAAIAASQPLDSDLTAIAALTTTTFGRALLALADAAAGRTALGLGTAATQATSAFDASGAAASAQAAAIAACQPLDSDLTAMAALSTTAFGRSLLTQADAAATRTTLGLGTAATQASAAFDASGAATTAQAAAISAAATDATTKANAAQAAAIAAAAAAVTTKADLRAPYLGPVATRCRIPSRTIASSTFKTGMTWSRHKATDDIAALRLLYTTINGTGEVSNSAGPGTVKASVEYPAGTITQITFSASATGTIPANDHLLSDLVTLSTLIPAGATFWVGTYVDWFGAGATNMAVMDDGLDPVLTVGYSRETTAFGAAVTDNTMTGTRVSSGHNPMNSYRPTLILGMTQRPTWALVGDSRTRENLSWETTIDAEGLRGLTEMVLGGRWGYVNLGVSTDSYTNVLSGTGNNYIKRLQLAAYCTHVLDDYGTNSVQVVSTAQMQTDVTNFRAKFAGKVYYKTTIQGQVTGRPILADGSDQTVSGTLSNLTTHNDWVRQGAAGVIDGYIELEDILSLRRGSGKWKGAERVVTDAAMTSGSNVLTSATAAFTSADLGKGINVTGVGAAGAAMYGLIGTVTNSTTVSLITEASTSAGVKNASTTASGQTLGVGVYTLDGIHQTREATKAIRDSTAWRPLTVVR